MPQSYIDCGMGDTGLVGDGCSYLTEQVRVAWMSAVGNQMYDSKTDHAGALGMLFTSANGGACVASPLYLGRASEANGVRSLHDELKGLPSMFWEQQLLMKLPRRSEQRFQKVGHYGSQTVNLLKPWTRFSMKWSTG